MSQGAAQPATSDSDGSHDASRTDAAHRYAASPTEARAAETALGTDGDAPADAPAAAGASAGAVPRFSPEEARTRRRFLRPTPRSGARARRGRTRSSLLPPASTSAAGGGESRSEAEDGEWDELVMDERAAYDLGRLVAPDYGMERLARHVVSNAVADPTILPGTGIDAERKRVRRLHGALSAHAPVSPPVMPAQEALCRRWIEQRLDTRLRDDLPLVAALRNGILLNLLLGEPAEDPKNEVVLMDAVHRNLRNFFAAARRLGLRDSECFDVDDLVLQRNVPRVIRTVAAVARLTDAERFSRCAANAPAGEPQPVVRWSEHDELNEEWPGSETLLKLTEAVKRGCGRRRLRILVAGTMGSGKSATIDQLVGRRTATQRHNVTLRLSDAEIREAAPEKDALEDIVGARARHEEIVQRLHPIRPYESARMPCDAVATYYVKVADVLCEITELPSMERYLADDEDGLSVWGFSGRREHVLERIRDREFEVALLVERLDLFRARARAAVFEQLQHVFGERLWERSVVVLTHGYSLPPEGLTFEENLARRMHVVQEAACRTCGRANMRVPVSAVENSDACPVSDSGERILPDGTAFMARLASLCEGVIVKQHARKPLLRVQPSAVRRWNWRRLAWAATFFGVLQLLARRLQR